MAGRRNGRLPPSNPHGRAIVRELESIQAHSGESLDRIFRWWLDVIEAALKQVPDEEFHRITRKNNRAVEAMVRALGELMLAAQEGYQDVLGPVFEAVGASSDGLGQFFTPRPVCQLLARMQLEGATPHEDGSPITIYDPCVGSGGMLLAAAEVAEELGLEVELHGSDIDPVCVQMSRLNLMIHGAAREARRAQSIAAGVEAVTRAARAVEAMIAEAPPPDAGPAPTRDVVLDGPMPLFAVLDEQEGTTA